jgi:hypothetical protein
MHFNKTTNQIYPERLTLNKATNNKRDTFVDLDLNIYLSHGKKMTHECSSILVMGYVISYKDMQWSCGISITDFLLYHDVIIKNILIIFC